MASIMGFFRKDPCKDAYVLGRQLGMGSFATVRRGTCKRDGSSWAIKIIKKRALTSADKAFLQKEVDVMEKLSKMAHPNIVELREVFDGSSNFYMVMELCSGGEVFDRIVEQEYYTESQAKKAVRMIASALDTCHKMGIVHRDLKPENLLYASEKSDVIKLADFGLSNILSPDRMLATACGTPGYVAPEVLMHTGYGSEVDMWSLGVITYILLCGCPPFYDENQARLFSKIKRGEFSFPSPFWDQVSIPAKELIDSMLIINPKKRATARDVMDHPWLASSEQPKEKDAKEAELVGFQTNMVLYNARRKFKAGLMTLQSVTYLHRKSQSRVTPGPTIEPITEAAGDVSPAPPRKPDPAGSEAKDQGAPPAPAAAKDGGTAHKAPPAPDQQ